MTQFLTIFDQFCCTELHVSLVSQIKYCKIHRTFVTVHVTYSDLFIERQGGDSDITASAKFKVILRVLNKKSIFPNASRVNETLQRCDFGIGVLKEFGST